MIDELTLPEVRETLWETRGRKPFIGEDGADGKLLRRALLHPDNAELLAALRRWGAKLKESPLAELSFSQFRLFGSTGDRKTYEKAYFSRRHRLNVFALLYTLEEDSEWLKPLEDTIWAILNEYTWVLPAHVGLKLRSYPLDIWDQPEPPEETVDLFAAETAFALAELMHLLGERLHPWIGHRIRAEIERRVFQVWYGDAAPQNWELKTNNWPAVCAGSGGAAALYLVDDPERLAGMVWRTIQALRMHLEGFDESGATPEGLMYWEYGFGFFAYFSELLRAKTRGRIDLLQGVKQRNIARFPGACILSGGKAVNFSDSGERAELWPGLPALLAARCGAEFGGETAEALRIPLNDNGVPRLAHLLRGLIWPEVYGRLGGGDGGETGHAVEHHYFEGHQWLISKVRRGGRLFAFAAKAGHNEEPHNHNDIGHFILHADGVNVLCDLGTGVYTRQYFMPEHRYDTWAAGSHGHSVPGIGDARQRCGIDARAEDVECRRGDDSVFFSFEMAKAYGVDTLVSLRRTFEWNAGDPGRLELTLTDRFVFADADGTGGADSVQETFIAAVEPQLAAPGTVRIGEVELEYDAESWKADVENGSFTEHSGEERPFWRILLRAKRRSPQLEAEFRFTVPAGAQAGRL